MQLKLLTVPHPILSKRAQEVELVDDHIREIMDSMLRVMYEDKGIGLGANQVGVLKRIIVLDLQNEDESARKTGFYPLFMANPKITKFSDNKIEADEGCLSVPGMQIPVNRPEEIDVEYLDYNNNLQKLSTKGWLARAIQHEIDHIDGKTLIDYLSPLKRSVALRKLKKQQRL